MSQITTHVLDTALGKPAEGVVISLSQAEGSQWNELSSGTTNEDGRVVGLLADDAILPAGRYRMHFDTESYFAAQGAPVFYPYADVVFQIPDGGDHYHIPLLLAPFGYSTYRGS